jgi:hypothetical protein
MRTRIATAWFSSRVAASLVIATSAIAGCAATSNPPAVADDAVTIEGTILSVDTKPWAYDGNAVVLLDTRSRGQVAVQLPARWNLCEATPVDVDALELGMKVRAVGSAGPEGAVIVCSDASHQLAPIR